MKEEDVIYNRIALLRTDRGVSRRELAQAMGVHYQTIGYLKRGEYAPSLHLALRIAALSSTCHRARFLPRRVPTIVLAHIAVGSASCGAPHVIQSE